MDMPVIDYLARWGHYLAGITWIGLLYYFNFVQGEYFKEADAGARTDAFTKLVPRALWWFRWGAMLTFLTGLILLAIRGAGVSVDATIGSIMAILMFLNVWLIIWPNQKILIESNEQVKAGGEALPEAAAAAPKALLASRTNVLFSIPMLYFMGSTMHTAPSWANGALMGADMTALILVLVIIAALEINAIVGKLGPIATIRGVIISGFVLWVVLLGLLRLVDTAPAAAGSEAMPAKAAPEMISEASAPAAMPEPANPGPDAMSGAAGSDAMSDETASDAMPEPGAPDAIPEQANPDMMPEAAAPDAMPEEAPADAMPEATDPEATPK